MIYLIYIFPVCNKAPAVLIADCPVCLHLIGGLWLKSATYSVCICVLTLDTCAVILHIVWHILFHWDQIQLSFPFFAHWYQIKLARYLPNSRIRVFHGVRRRIRKSLCKSAWHGLPQCLWLFLLLMRAGRGLVLYISRSVFNEEHTILAQQWSSTMRIPVLLSYPHCRQELEPLVNLDQRSMRILWWFNTYLTLSQALI